jgi:hypothetical protein
MVLYLPVSITVGTAKGKLEDAPLLWITDRFLSVMIEWKHVGRNDIDVHGSQVQMVVHMAGMAGLSLMTKTFSIFLEGSFYLIHFALVFDDG